MSHKTNEIMKATYYLNESRKKNLYCRINDGKERVTFSLDYTVDKKEWDLRNETVKFENEYYYVISNFKNYLNEKYEEFRQGGKDEILDRLKNEALSLTEDCGIEGIAKKLFNYYNKKHDIPQYDDFIKAFEKYSNLGKEEYRVQTIGTVIHFHTKKTIYEMNTYEGKTAELKSIIENRYYSEIYTQTNKNIWSEIYLDGGLGNTFSKGDFLPSVLNEWEIYWSETYQDVKEKNGKTDHLNSMKEDSWRRFQVFMECYNYDGDAIKLSCKIDDMILFLFP